MVAHGVAQPGHAAGGVGQQVEPGEPQVIRQRADIGRHRVDIEPLRLARDQRAPMPPHVRRDHSVAGRGQALRHTRQRPVQVVFRHPVRGEDRGALADVLVVEAGAGVIEEGHAGQH